MIEGISIILHKRVEGDVDPFNHPTVSYEDITIDDVLVGNPSTEDYTNILNMYGKRVAYTLAIPKGDTNDWVNALVTLPEPFPGVYRTIGEPIAGIEANIPLRWNKKILLERYGDKDVEEG